MDRYELTTEQASEVKRVQQLFRREMPEYPTPLHLVLYAVIPRLVLEPERGFLVAVPRTVSLGGLPIPQLPTELRCTVDVLLGLGGPVNPVDASGNLNLQSPTGRWVYLTDRIEWVGLASDKQILRLGQDLTEVLANNVEPGVVSATDLRAVSLGDPRAMTRNEIEESYFDEQSKLTVHPMGELFRDYLALSGDPLRGARSDKQMRGLHAKLTATGFIDIPEPVPRER